MIAFATVDLKILRFTPARRGASLPDCWQDNFIDLARGE